MGCLGKQKRELVNSKQYFDRKEGGESLPRYLLFFLGPMLVRLVLGSVLDGKFDEWIFVKIQGRISLQPLGKKGGRFLMIFKSSNNLTEANLGVRGLQEIFESCWVFVGRVHSTLPVLRSWLSST